MKQEELNWFRPLWRRVLVVAFLAIWCGWEWLSNKDQFWGTLTALALAYALYNFFYALPRQSKDDPTLPPPPEA